MKNILFAILVLMYLPAFGQNNIKKTAAVTYTLGPPTYTVSLPSSSEIAVDTSTGKIYQYHRTTSTWLQLGQGIDVISGTIPPAYTPLRNMSKFAINGDNELYYYTGSSWVQINAGSGGTGGHVILEGNTPRAQRDSMEFQSNSSIVLAATNTSTRTVVEATIESNAVGSAEIAANAVGSSEIAADAVGNSELAANAVDSTNVINYGLSVLDLGQHGASTGSVLKWNGTQWAPAADDDMPAVTANQIAYGTGSAITGHNRLTVDPTATATRLRLSGSGSGGGITIDSIGPGDKGLEMYSYSATATEVPFLYAERSGANAAATMEMYANDAGAASDAVLKLRTQTGGAGDPMVQFTTDPGGSVGVWLIGVDNDDSDRLKIGRASSFSSGTDSYAITADNTTNNVYIGNGLLLPRDITTNISTSQNDYNPSGFTSASTYGFTSTGNVNITGITAGEDGRVLILTNRDATDNITLVNESASSTAANRFAIGSDITFGPGYSAVLRYDIASSRWRCIAKHTASTADNWGSQVVATDATLVGDGTSGNPLSWNGASTGGPISGNGFSGTPITVLNDAITAQYIAASAVTSSEIRDTTIVTQDIKDGAVTNAKLASGTGGMFKGSGTFASGAVGKLPSGNNIAYTYNNDNPAIYIDDASGDATVYSSDGSNSISIGNGGILQQSNDGIAQYAPYTSITNGTTASELRFLEPSGSGTNYTGFKTSARADNRLYTMPTDTPADGDIWTWHTGDNLSWDTPSAGGIYGNGTAGSGNGDIPNGGSTATVTGDDPLILNLDAAAGQTNRMLRLVTDYSAEDAITKMLQLVAPTDSLIVISQDQSIVFEYKGPPSDGTSLTISSNQKFTVDATTGTVIKGDGTELSVVGETILGSGAAAPLVNQIAHGSGSITTTGDAQSSEVILRRTITGTSATELFLDGASIQAILPATNRIWTGTAKCSGSVTDVGNGATIVVGDTHARYQTFTVKRVGSSTTLMTAATGLTDTWTDTNMAGAAFTLTADNTTEALKITFTPPTLAGSTTVCKAVCTVNVNELGF
jgi:hypothetical protein